MVSLVSQKVSWTCTGFFESLYEEVVLVQLGHDGGPCDHLSPVLGLFSSASGFALKLLFCDDDVKRRRAMERMSFWDVFWSSICLDEDLIFFRNLDCARDDDLLLASIASYLNSDDEDVVLSHVLRLVRVGVGRRDVRRARFDRREISAMMSAIKRAEKMFNFTHQLVHNL